MPTSSENYIPDDANHIIGAITHYMTKIERIDTQQKQLKKKVNVLTKQMVFEARRETEFVYLFGAT